VRVRVRVRGACLRMSTINITPIRAKAARVELCSLPQFFSRTESVHQGDNRP